MVVTQGDIQREQHGISPFPLNPSQAAELPRGQPEQGQSGQKNIKGMGRRWKQGGWLSLCRPLRQTKEPPSKMFSAGVSSGLCPSGAVCFRVGISGHETGSPDLSTNTV